MNINIHELQPINHNIIVGLVLLLHQSLPFLLDLAPSIVGCAIGGIKFTIWLWVRTNHPENGQMKIPTKTVLVIWGMFTGNEGFDPLPYMSLPQNVFSLLWHQLPKWSLNIHIADSVIVYFKATAAYVSITICCWDLTSDPLAFLLPGCLGAVQVIFTMWEWTSGRRSSLTWANMGQPMIRQHWKDGFWSYRML